MRSESLRSIFFHTIIFKIICLLRTEPSELWKRKTLVPFAISMTLMIFQQWSGVNTVIFNTVTIFTAARVSIDKHLASNMVGIVQLLATACKNYFSNVSVSSKTECLTPFYRG